MYVENLDSAGRTRQGTGSGESAATPVASANFMHPVLYFYESSRSLHSLLPPLCPLGQPFIQSQGHEALPLHS